MFFLFWYLVVLALRRQLSRGARTPSAFPNGHLPPRVSREDKQKRRKGGKTDNETRHDSQKRRSTYRGENAHRRVVESVGRKEGKRREEKRATPSVDGTSSAPACDDHFGLGSLLHACHADDGSFPPSVGCTCCCYRPCACIHHRYSGGPRLTL